MSECKFSDITGLCQMADFDDNDKYIENPCFKLGVEGEGYCVVEDDPDPSMSCDSYEPINDYEEEEENE